MSRLLQLPLDLVVSGQQSNQTFVWEAANSALQHFWFASETAAPQFVWLWGRAGVGKSHLLHAKAQAQPEFIYLPAFAAIRRQ
jgi:chromosomal replication initiation ATPase DnaA